MDEKCMRYKEIVFDVDGTLIDTEYAVLHSLQDTVCHFTGKTPEIESLTFALGITGEDALLRLRITDVDNALTYWEHALKTYHQSIRVFDGIERLLCDLTARGYNLGIVTSKTRAEYETDFACFDIARHFSRVVCADDSVMHKPDPEPLLKYMEKAKCSETELLYIGDSIYDRRCAESARCAFALALWGAKKDMDGVCAFATPGDLLNSLI